MKETDMEFTAWLRERLQRELERYDYPSVAIGIMKDGETLMAEGIGFRDVRNRLCANQNTIYYTASCGKAFTVALVDLLVDQGKLSWDEPIVRYCPELGFADPYVTANVSMRDLLCHRTGLPRHDYTWYNTGMSKTEIVMNMRYYEMNKPFRTTFQYSNQCYMMAGYIIERLTGMSFERCLETMLFEPLGLKHPAIFTDDVLREPNRALPYARPDNPNTFVGKRELPVVSSPAEDCEKRIGDSANPSGCISMDVEDSLKWVGMWLNKGMVGDRQLIREQTLEENFYPNITVTGPTEICTDYSYGMGWFAATYRGQKFYEHGGNIEGFTALTFLWPKRNIGMAIYTNFSNSLVGRAVMYSLIDHELGSSERDWFDYYYERIAGENRKTAVDPLTVWKNMGILGEQVKHTVPSHALEDYCGCYRHKGYDPVLVGIAEGKLQLSCWLDQIPLGHYHYDTFLVEGFTHPLPYGMPAIFETDGISGKISRLKIRLNLEDGAEPICFVKE